MAYGQFSISNEAKAEIRCPSIVAMNEQSVEAQACTRFHQPILDEMLEIHEWGFAIRHVVLAATTNARPGEWGYAYATPIDVGTPRLVLPMSTGTWIYPYAHGVDRAWTDYIIEDAVLYTSFPTATLEYGLNSANVSDLPALFRRALVLALGSRLVVELRDSPDRQDALDKRAGLALRPAMADDLNRQPTHDDHDDVGAARHGYGVDCWPTRRLPGLV